MVIEGESGPDPAVSNAFSSLFHADSAMVLGIRAGMGNAEKTGREIGGELNARTRGRGGVPGVSTGPKSVLLAPMLHLYPSLPTPNQELSS